jgi:hypothetical protein
VKSFNRFEKKVYIMTEVDGCEQRRLARDTHLNTPNASGKANLRASQAALISALWAISPTSLRVNSLWTRCRKKLVLRRVTRCWGECTYRQTPPIRAD